MLGAGAEREQIQTEKTGASRSRRCDQIAFSPIAGEAHKVRQQAEDRLQAPGDAQQRDKRIDLPRRAAPTLQQRQKRLIDEPRRCLIRALKEVQQATQAKQPKDPVTYYGES